MSYQIPVFLSYPTPHLKKQELFIRKIRMMLDERGFCPTTIKVSQLSVDEPLHAIRQAMSECSGLIAIAFKRTLIINGETRPGCDNGTSSTIIDSKWLSSVYSHIEPAMAFQAGLPVVILKEKDILAEGILEKEIPGISLKEFLLEDDLPVSLAHIIDEWELRVKKAAGKKLRSIA